MCHTEWKWLSFGSVRALGTPELNATEQRFRPRYYPASTTPQKPLFSLKPRSPCAGGAARLNMLSMPYSRSPKRPLIASEAPPRPPLRHVLAASVAVSLPLMTLALISNSVSDLLFLPPIGAAMALIVGAPNLPLAQPRNVVLGHLIGCLTGIVVSRFLGSTIITAAIAAGVAFALMLIARAAHSPATATAIVTVLLPHSSEIFSDVRLLGFVFASSIMIVMLGILANRLRGLRYPTYWW